MDSVDSDKIKVGENKFVSKSVILSHLETYNLYYEGEALQLRHREEEGELIIEGLLNVFWGVRRPIRLQMEDEKETSRPRPSLTSLSAETDIDTVENHETNQPCPSIDVTAADDQSKDSGEEKEEAGKGQQESTHSDRVGRTRSDVGGRRISGRRLGIRRVKRHRCSFNGHFYNHKTAVFTPAFGSVTNVRINSCMTTTQVMRVLLNKFKIENCPDEFSLYLVHTSGERHQLKPNDHPLVVRVLKGPCEQVSKIFLMETDQVEEVTYDVAQYIKFELPVLQSFIAKLQEEEEREMQKLKKRYADMHRIIKRYMKSLSDKTT
ncbi:ras association domain-containing protein 2b [Ctenopharyngodon idella]|uniref:ras association domain-containing protein 2b n=1 Tax=Ctenopharyngodon idella TaxID=7959 RepID=UPI002230E741|nr:ras association domain-containing protein 2b [Ctenopharyngodon idella]XP_051764753.1 ras association domain-containing protein 2b [Ctenopharyngodon idella]XP_051764754.1 ras association domain-containing protein 2b [Ctenopharyngodon idella]